MEHIKNKAIRLIDYLTELALLRSKIVRDISAYQSVLWLHEIPQELEYCFTKAWGTNEEFDENIWIEVKKYDEPILDEIPMQRWTPHKKMSSFQQIKLCYQTFPG